MGTVEIATRLGGGEYCDVSEWFHAKRQRGRLLRLPRYEMEQNGAHPSGESTEDEEDEEGDMTRHNPKEDATTTSRWSVDGGVGNSLSLSLSLVGLGYT